MIGRTIVKSVPTHPDMPPSLSPPRPPHLDHPPKPGCVGTRPRLPRDCRFRHAGLGPVPISPPKPSGDAVGRQLE